MTSALFIHHGIGRQLVLAGLRTRLATGPHPIDLWNHDRNEIGLTGPDGTRTATAFPIPGDDTDPVGLLTTVEALAAKSMDAVPDHHILVLKSCSPNSAIASGAALAELKDLYRHLRVAADDLPAHVVLSSSPPLVIEATDRDQADRAVALREWLASDWPGNGRSFVDLHAALSHGGGPLRGTLRTGFRRLRRGDSHLSTRGARAGAAVLAEAIHAAARRW